MREPNQMKFETKRALQTSTQHHSCVSIKPHELVMPITSRVNLYDAVMDTPKNLPTLHYVTRLDFTAPTEEGRKQAFREFRLRVNHAKTKKVAKFTEGHIYWTGKLSLMILSSDFDLKLRFAKESPEIMLMAKKFAKLHLSAIATHFATIKSDDAAKFAVYHTDTQSARPLIIEHARQCRDAAITAASTFQRDLKLVMPCA